MAVEDDDAQSLSHVGQAAYDCLRYQHVLAHHKLWNVTSGKVMAIDATPLQAFLTETTTRKLGVVEEDNDNDNDNSNNNDNQPTPITTVVYSDQEGHSDWFPRKLGQLVSQTEIWCDVTSLAPPDGLFLQELRKALTLLHSKQTHIIVRLLFGNIIGMPVNCTAVMNQLTVGIPHEDTKLQIWVGAWRRGVSWNHSKLIAIDGHVLHTGGHNLWDDHYCRHDPVHDLSMELHGRVAHDGHLYANAQWEFIEFMQQSCCGWVIDKLPDSLPLVLKTRVTVSEFPPRKVSIFPPLYRKGVVPRQPPNRQERASHVPIITMGRYGKLTPFQRRPSDDAIMAMLQSAKTVIHLALQDLGPVCIPGTKIALPGCVWPKEYLSALGKVIWERGVDVEIVLSNPNSIPGGLTATEANYGNGWSCVDVAAEIIKTIREQYPTAQDGQLRQKVRDNLRVCFLREAKLGQRWKDGMTMAMHAKHFIVDDTCYYVGSQNLYIWYVVLEFRGRESVVATTKGIYADCILLLSFDSDLAEWGVVVDHPGETTRIMNEYWDPLWKASYTPEDCDVQAVMDGLDINRDGEDPNHLSAETQKLMDSRDVKSVRKLAEAGKQGSMVIPESSKNNFFDEEKSEK